MNEWMNFICYIGIAQYKGVLLEYIQNTNNKQIIKQNINKKKKAPGTH